MLIYLIRHGETAFNAERRYQGKLDIPLSEEGRAALRPAAFCPGVVFASPLRRAAQTARILFPAARIVTVEGLREMDFGDFEGRCFSELSDSAAYRAWVEGGCEARCPGGSESKPEFIRRTCEAFSTLVDNAYDGGQDRLVIVAHGGTQMAVLSALALPKRDFYEWRGENGCGFVLDDARWRRERVLTIVDEHFCLCERREPPCPF